MTQLILPDNLYSVLRKYEQRIDRLERALAIAGAPEGVHYVSGVDSLGTFYKFGWTNFDPSAGPAGRELFFYKDRGRVYIEGVVKGGASGTVVFTLPVGYRPFYQTNNPVTNQVAASGGIAQLSVAVNGDVTLTNVTAGTNVSAFALISGVSFRHA